MEVCLPCTKFASTEPLDVKMSVSYVRFGRLGERKGLYALTEPEFVVIRSWAGLPGEEAEAGLGLTATLTEPEEVVMERRS